MGKYDDIINLQHHVSTKHPRLSVEQRAAQFAPYSALSGYGDAIKETSRITENKIELSDDEKSKIDNILQQIMKEISNKPKVTITYFIPDMKKKGGKYNTQVADIKKVDKFKQIIILEDKTEIPIQDVIKISFWDNNIVKKIPK